MEIARARAPADRPFVYVNMADAVLVGTGTLRAEGYDRLMQRRARRVAAGLAADPLAVLISRRFDIPWEAGLFQACGTP